MADESIELGDYGAVLGRHRGLIAASALMVGLLAVVGLGSAGYKATADVLIAPIASAGTSPNDVQPDRLINTGTERELASSAAVAQIAAETLGSDDPRGLLSHLGVAVTPDTQVLSFSYTAPTEEASIAGAQAFADAYLEYRATRAIDIRDERIDEIETELDQRSASLIEANVIVNRASDADRANDPTALELAEAQSRRELLLGEVSELNSSLADLNEQRIDPGEVIAPATEGTSTGQSTFVLFAIGAAVGAVLGAAAAFVVDRLRARINRPQDLADELGAPVLATIPAGRASQDMVTLSAPESSAAHSYRRLAVALTSDPDRPLRWVLVAGAGQQEPRTQVTVNLAVALLQQGRRVLIVSGDRHDSGVDRYFDLVGRPGFDQHLSGEAAPPPVEVQPGLHVLPAGTGASFPRDHVPPQQAVAAVLERGRRLADVVLVDAPPALDYSDAEAIGPLVDAVLVVASAERTPRAEVAELRDRLRLVIAPVRGAVLVRRLRLLDELLLRLRERAGTVRTPAVGTGLSPAPGVRGTAWAEDVGVAGGRSPEEYGADAAALKDRIEALLRRHTPTGLTPRLPDPSGAVATAADGDAVDRARGA